MSLTENLKNLNLTEYETKAYIALVKNGELTARELSSTSELPYSKTYEITSLLERKGLIEIQQGRPKLFRATSPRNALHQYAKRFEEDLTTKFSVKKQVLEYEQRKNMETLSESVIEASSILQRLFDERDSISASNDLIWTIRGKDNVVSQVIEMIDTSKSLKMVIHEGLYRMIRRDLAMAKAKGDMILQQGEVLKADIPDKINVFPMEDMAFECGVIIGDDDTALFTTKDLETAFRSTNQGLITILTHFFDHEKEESTTSGRK